MWYKFWQNNSGGFFLPPAIYIFVEADNSEQADTVALSIEGVYFSGVASGTDCSCCGDRWSRAWSDDGYDTLEEAIAGNYFPSIRDAERYDGIKLIKIVNKQ